MPGLASLSRVIGPQVNKKTAAFYLTTKPFPGGGTPFTRMFQYFPETITDSKAVNWSPKDIPGGSLPLYQWVQSGERQIGFTAYFTSDVNLDLVDDQKLKDAGVSYRNVDVKSALLWLRLHQVPRYIGESALGTPYTQAPRAVVLTLPNSGIGLMGGWSNMGADEMLALMTQCDITYEAFWPQGAPRIASVQLSFVQTAQDPETGTVVFPQYTEAMADCVFGKNGNNIDSISTTTKQNNKSGSKAPPPRKTGFRGYQLVPKSCMRG